MSPEEIPYGPVYITEGSQKGRIGYYDDEGYEYSEDLDWEDSSIDHESDGIHVGYVYFGSYFVANGHFIIPLEHFREVTTADLMRRREELHDLCGAFAQVKAPNLELSHEEKFNFLAELHYVDAVLIDRMIEVRYMNSTSGKRVFISHSSKDKGFATWLGTDLKAAGHTPWFDTWDIRVGESIPEEISDGLQSADFVVVVLSEHAVSSRWVEREWHTKYWSEVELGRIQVLPVVLRDCDIPTLLKAKKYADFRESYNDGSEDVLLAIDSLSKASKV